MNKIATKLVCMLIPSKRIRQKIRARYYKRKNKSSEIMELWSLHEKVSYIIERQNEFQMQAMQRLQYLESLIKNNHRVDSAPPAIGYLSLIQKASAAILAKFAAIMERNGIQFWLDAGTLIGHVRHGGFVPWDDEIDVGMMRDDYESLPELLSGDFLEEGFFFRNSDLTRLYYKDLRVWVDIIPYDVGPAVVPYTGKEYDDFFAILDDIRSHYQFDSQKWINREAPMPAEHKPFCIQQRDERLVKQAVPGGFLFRGVEHFDSKKKLFPDKWIHPLIPAEFMGIPVYVPNRADLYLQALYGDYMGWPKSFNATHDASYTLSHLTTERIEEMQELITNYLPKL